MFNNLINKYLNNLSREDILNFSLKNNIILEDLELDYIYKTIKEKYQILLSDNYDVIFNEAKNHLSNINLKKIYNLFINYRLIYQKFIN